MALVRMPVWLVGDYAVWLGELARIEAAGPLLLALAFVWLRPRPGGRAMLRWQATGVIVALLGLDRMLPNLARASGE